MAPVALACCLMVAVLAGGVPQARAQTAAGQGSAAAEAVTYRIESQPYGADVRLVTPSGTTRLLGTTPLDLTLSQPLDGALVVALSGYGEARIMPGRDVRNVHRVVLARQAEGVAPLVVRVRPRPSRWWVDALAFGVAAAGTVVAIDQKTRADDLYEVYRETGDDALRPPMKRYDTRAGVALGIGTLGLGVFTVRLARRR